MFMRLARTILQGLLVLLLPTAASAIVADAGTLAPIEQPAPAASAKRYAVIGTYVFHLAGADGKMSAARLVLEKGAGLLSCFIEPPASIVAAHPATTRIESREGTYTCFAGREPLEALALEKTLVRTWAPRVAGQPPSGTCQGGAAMALGSSTPGRAKLFDNDDEWDDEWDQEDQLELEDNFWGSFGSVGGGGFGAGNAQCMSQCASALATALRFCVLAPDPIRELCALGAGALYVACIATC